MPTSTTKRTGHRLLIGSTLVAALALALGASARAAETASTTTTKAASSGVTRVQWQASPVNAPGQELYLQKITIDPGAKLPEHYHQGTQVARVAAGTLSYTMVSGTATVYDRKGVAREVTGPRTIKLRVGEALVEPESLVHFGANETSKPVVLDVTALLQVGAPLATTVGAATPGTGLKLNVNLESQSRVLMTAGPNGVDVYGWNRLGGTAVLDGQPVTLDMLASVDYTSGNGPFSGFITFGFADGSTLAVSMQGITKASADTSNATFAATLGVITGTGRYVDAAGTGTFNGTRTAALGTAVVSTFDLRITTK